MSKRGLVLGGIALVLLVVSIAMFIFGKTGKSITYGIIGLVITFIYVLVLRLIGSFNKARLQRRAMDDIHKIAEK